MKNTPIEIENDAEARARDLGMRIVDALNPLLAEMKLTQAETDLAFASLLAVSVAAHCPDRAGRERAARRLCEIILGLAEEFAEAKRTGSLHRPN